MTASHPFRFGVVSSGRSGTATVETARRVHELGYSTLLTPDVLQLPSPVVSLAVAATAAPIRVGTWVLASPLRTPATAAWEAHSLTVMTDGRFDLGIGTGLPDQRASAEQLGLPYPDGAGRRDQVRRTVELLRDLDGDVHTPVLIPTGGPAARELAAELADIATFAFSADTPREAVTEMVTDLRTKAGGRADELELALNLWAVRDRIPPQAQRISGADLAGMRAADSLALLDGDTDAMVGELQRRRDELGFSYICVSDFLMEDLAPVVERLSGT